MDNTRTVTYKAMQVIMVMGGHPHLVYRSAAELAVVPVDVSVKDSIAGAYYFTDCNSVTQGDALACTGASANFGITNDTRTVLWTMRGGIQQGYFPDEDVRAVAFQ